MNITRYDNTMDSSWNVHVVHSRNATFLHCRDYMDYHSDRFHDHSLLFHDDKGKLVAVLPANEDGDTLYSHQGLTYGGLLLTEKTTAVEVADAFRLLMDYARKKGFRRIIYKPVPEHYHIYPAQEDLYALFYVAKPQLVGRNIASVIDLKSPLKWSQNRRLGANRAERNGYHVRESGDYASFWRILEDNLRVTYGATPVHTLKEISRLQNRFRYNIRLFMAYDAEGIPQAGTVIYEMGPVVHTQYISATAEGKRCHAVDFLFRAVIRYYSQTRRYFDFGTSNEQGGAVLNESLIHQKEGFGGRGIVYDTWEIPL